LGQDWNIGTPPVGAKTLSGLFGIATLIWGNIPPSTIPLTPISPLTTLQESKQIVWYRLI
jgi:hypothetical protein